MFVLRVQCEVGGGRERGGKQGQGEAALSNVGMNVKRVQFWTYDNVKYGRMNWPQDFNRYLWDKVALGVNRHLKIN